MCRVAVLREVGYKLEDDKLCPKQLFGRGQGISVITGNPLRWVHILQVFTIFIHLLLKYYNVTQFVLDYATLRPSVVQTQVGCLVRGAHAAASAQS